MTTLPPLHTVYDGYSTDDYIRKYVVECEWSIIPVRQKAKDPCGPWKTAQKQRATVADALEWRARYANHGIAIVTGTISRVIVIDVDDLTLHSEFLATLPRTATVATSKGHHYYYEIYDTDIVPTKVGFKEKVDIRGEGGFVVAPPSRHASDSLNYEWVVPIEEMVPAPGWLIDQINTTQTKGLQTKTVDGRTTWDVGIAGVSEGGRNAAAAAIAGKMFETSRELWPLLWDAFKAWNSRNRPPLDEAELRTVFNSIQTKEKAKRELQTQYYVAPKSATTMTEAIVPKRDQIIKNFAVAGLTVLIGKPKRGKSIFMLQVALSVASGRPLFADRLRALTAKRQYEIEQHDVLYLALEDDESRFISRSRDLFGSHALPAGLYYSCNWNPMQAGGLTRLEQYLAANPKTRMVVIDTLSAFSGGVASKMTNAFKADYAEARPLFDLAIKYNVSIFVVHHARKTPTGNVFDQDPMDQISGTLGAAAVVDTYMYFDREIHSEYAILHVVGRDLSAHMQVLHQAMPEDLDNAPLPRFEIGDLEAVKKERTKKKR